MSSARSPLIGALAGVLAALAGCGQPNGPVGARHAPGDTPQVVLEACVSAMDRSDFLTAVTCLTPESVRLWARACAWDGLDSRDDFARVYLKGMAKRGDEERKKWDRRQARHAARVGPLLLAHGLTRQVVEGLKRHRSEEAARDALAEQLRDPAGFLAGYLRATREDRPRWRKGGWARPWVEGVVVRGDAAEAKVGYVSAHTDSGKERLRFTMNVPCVRMPSGEWRVGDWELLERSFEKLPVDD